MDFLSIEDTLLHLDIKPGMTACEFGCGSAHFTLTLAKKLRGGRVYALDIQEEKLSALKNVSTSKKHHNVVTMLSDLEAPGGSGLKSNSLDIVVIPNLLFQSEKKYAIIKEAYRILKKTGQCLVLEWLDKNHLVSQERLIHPDQIKTMAETLHFSLKKEFAAGDYHYGLVLIK